VIAMRSRSSTITYRRAATTRLPNVHPGEVLLEEFLKPMDISAYRLAKETALSQTRVSEIIRGQRSITAETALRFSKYFGNSAEFWLGLQNDHDLEESRLSLGKELESIRTLSGPGRTSAADRARKGASAAIGGATGARAGRTKT
jgi:addiction module HigA family antidote